LFALHERQVHGGADLDFMIHKAKDGLDGETAGMLADIQGNRFRPLLLLLLSLLEKERAQPIAPCRSMGNAMLPPLPPSPWRYCHGDTSTRRDSRSTHAALHDKAPTPKACVGHRARLMHATHAFAMSLPGAVCVHVCVCERVCVRAGAGMSGGSRVRSSKRGGASRAIASRRTGIGTLS
jgi:hypothetical protein